MTDDLVSWLRETEDHLYGATRCREAADRIEHLERELGEERHSREVAAAKGWEFSDRIKELEKKIAVMEVGKSLAAACLPSGYVRQTFKTGTGDFAEGGNK